MVNIRNFCIIAHIDHGKSTLADRMLELTKTVGERDMKDQLLDTMDLERERGITIKLQPVRMLYKASLNNADYTQTDAEKTLLYEELTYKIRGAIFEVKKNIGLGHKESVYHKALEIEFKKSNIIYETEKQIDIIYDDEKIGTYRPDFIIDNKIIIELKALPFIGKNELSQAWTYLKGSAYKLLQLVNFSPTDVDVRRIVYDTARIPRESASGPRQSAQVEYTFNLIDTPGHVDFSYEVSRTLAAVEGAILLVDATQGIQAQTLANLYQAQAQNLDIIPIVNKIDMPNANVEGTKKELAELLKIDVSEVLAISAKTGEGVSKIFDHIIKKIKAPQVEIKKPLKALIFDSVYDTYRGVVAHVRLVDGQISRNEKIRFIASNATDEALEVGYFNPKYVKSDELRSGDIGYIVTGLKDIKSCKVGDTITQVTSDNGQETSKTEPLKGYKQIQPMVYAGFYSKDGEVDKLRDALEKLALNDASLSFEPENSSVFGFGFKCGFLGLLHLDIIKERLTREYNLNLIITSPKVNYQEKKVGGKIQYSEPWVKLEIVTPSEYIGQIMKIVMDIRGNYLDTKYISNRALIYFEAPLANIITNFYDRLKSASAGYASLNYEFLEYREEKLEKMDILVAGETMDTLSQIVHKDEIYQKGHSIVKKLKEHLPKQMFKVTLQAAIGGKIVAREDIPAMKKDVTGHLYGGDISRKQKLWKKQQKGKKKMQKIGKLDIPTDVFIKIMKD